MIELKVTPEQLKVIELALNQMPYGQVAALFAELGKQVVEQQNKNIEE